MALGPPVRDNLRPSCRARSMERRRCGRTCFSSQPWALPHRPSTARLAWLRRDGHLGAPEPWRGPIRRKRQRPCGQGVHNRCFKAGTLVGRQRRQDASAPACHSGHDWRSHGGLPANGAAGLHHPPGRERLPARDGRALPVASASARPRALRPAILLHWALLVGSSMRLGGGWGAMVTPTLIGQGAVPRLVIGSGNLAEFFVTTVVTATFGDDFRAGAVAHHHGLGSWRSDCGAVRGPSHTESG